MGSFRLHLDCAVPGNEEEVVAKLLPMLEAMKKLDWDGLRPQYRLGHDDDRQKSNHLDKNENGHVSNKKFSLIN